MGAGGKLTVQNIHEAWQNTNNKTNNNNKTEIESIIKFSMFREKGRKRKKNVGEMFIKNKVLFNQKMSYPNSLQHPFSSFIISKFKVEQLFFYCSLNIYLFIFSRRRIKEKGVFSLMHRKPKNFENINEWPACQHPVWLKSSILWFLIAGNVYLYIHMYV